MDEQTLLINEDTIKENINRRSLIKEIEQAYANHTAGESYMPPREHIGYDDIDGEIVSMPAKLEDNTIGLKWASDYPQNTGYPSVMGVMIYNDKNTGKPLAVIDSVAENPRF